MPADLPPPVVPETARTAAGPDLGATGRMDPVKPDDEPELDPRQLKALSRQERKEAKAALRREQQEARNAARQAKAMAKAAAKAERTTAAAAQVGEPVLPPEEPGELSGDKSLGDEDRGDEDRADEDRADEAITEVVEPIDSDAPQAEGDDAPEASEAPVATDPRARAAQRVQRRLGKDAEKLSAAEARARAREEARRRRAQAKEQRSGIAAEEVVRPPEGPTEGNLAEDVSVVELAGQAIEDESIMDEPAIDEPLIDEPVIDEVVDEPALAEEPGTPELDTAAAVEPSVEDVFEDDVEDDVEEPEPDLPEPVVEQRIDELGPVDVIDQPESVETRAIPPITPTTLPMDSDEEPKSRRSLAPIAGVVGLAALGISVLLAVGALLVALGFDSGGLYEVLRTGANFLVGPLEGAFDFSGANAERKEHFLAWGAGSIGYLLISFVGQAVQRANDD